MNECAAEQKQQVVEGGLAQLVKLPLFFLRIILTLCFCGQFSAL